MMLNISDYFIHFFVFSEVKRDESEVCIYVTQHEKIGPGLWAQNTPLYIIKYRNT